MFMGEFNHSIDAKGRLIIPARFREQLGDSFVVTRGYDHCLYIYNLKEWAAFEAKLNDIPLSDKNGRKVKRFFLSSAVPCEVDKQGRILIPATLRAKANLEKEVTLAGTGNHIEIWDREAFEDANPDDIDDDIQDGMKEYKI